LSQYPRVLTKAYCGAAKLSAFGKNNIKNTIELKNKLLIIEDEPELLATIATVFEIHDYNVLTASNGTEAMDMLRNEQVELVLCDVNLPDITGYDILNFVRRNHKLCKTPFIFLTAYHQASDVRRGMNAGADDYIPKPFVNAELLAAVESRVKLAALRKLNELNEANENKLNLLANLTVDDTSFLERKLQIINDALSDLIKDSTAYDAANTVATIKSIAGATTEMWALLALRELKRKQKKDIIGHAIEKTASVVFISDIMNDVIKKIKPVFDDLEIPLHTNIKPMIYTINNDEGYYEFFGAIILAFAAKFSDVEKVSIDLKDCGNHIFELNVSIIQTEINSKKWKRRTMFQWDFMDKANFLEMCKDQNLTAVCNLEVSKKSLTIRNTQYHIF
jgi:CheY-like chemotaxis protein